MACQTACQMLAVQWGLLLSMATGVLGADSSIIGMAAAGSISFLLLVAIMFFISLSFSWSDWVNTFMTNKGKVLMPPIYWQNKEAKRKLLFEAKRKLLFEAKRKLLFASTSHVTASVVNGQLQAQDLDRATENKNNRAASCVQGWSQRTNQCGNIYEEKDVTMDMGEEADDEFRIETVLTDNEVLDLGPFKTFHSNEQVIQGDVYAEPYIYSMVDKTSSRLSSAVTAITEPIPMAATTMTTTSVDGMVSSGDMHEMASEVSGHAQATSFEDMLIQI